MALFHLSVTQTKRRAGRALSVLREAPKVRCHIALRYVFWGLGGRFPPTSEARVQRLLDSRFCKSLYKHLPCLPSVTSQTRLLLFNKCLWLYKQKIKSHHSSARSAISLASLTASASRSLFSSPVFCSMFATWNLTVDISQPISAAMRV